MGSRRIGFFGGSFDPPHRGHLMVAQAAAKAFALDRVLLVPTGRQPLKPDGATASFADRLEMVRLLCGDARGLEASSLDAPRTDAQPNYTVGTLARMQGELGTEAAIFVIVGVDAFLELPRWREPDELLRLAEWIVVTRPGFALQQLNDMDLTSSQRARIHLLDGIAEEVSATVIRNALHEGRDCSEFVPTAVLDYIMQHHLYETQ
jgi:nicotinate-nucleotide adenylyltransferase